jgi:enamine deaminase RidA (YjgF/YER057c/UK114 family)
MPLNQHAWTALGVRQLIPVESKIEIDMIVLLES